MDINYIIVEDESLSAQMLESMIKELRPDWNHLGSFDGVADTTQWLKENKDPELIFLDIQLSDGLCFSIFEKVKVDSAIIFTTAYDDHAMKAFELNSVDYLLKPIKESALEKAFLKMEVTLEKLLSEVAPSKPNYEELLQSLNFEKKQYRKRFLVSRREEMKAVATQDVAYIYFENKITYLVTFDKQRYIVPFALDKLEEELDPEIFIRANRQVIININAINNLENYFGGKLIVKLLPELDYKTVVSRAKATTFKDWLGS